jgi:hypothetical protein
MQELIRIQLNEEFLANFGELEAAGRILEDANERTLSYKSEPSLAVDEILRRVRQDRYDLYFTTEKSIVYEMDRNQLLSMFYTALNRTPKDVPLTSEHIETLVWINYVVSRGRKYLSGTGRKYEPERNPIEQVHNELRLAEGVGARVAWCSWWSVARHCATRDA